MGLCVILMLNVFFCLRLDIVLSILFLVFLIDFIILIFDLVKDLMMIFGDDFEIVVLIIFGVGFNVLLIIFDFVYEIILYF